MPQKLHKNVMELFETKALVKVCAPMVRYSKLQFRNLVKNYDCDLVFTPMIMADSFCKSGKARDNEFTTNSLDNPLIVQFAANTVHDFAGAAYLVSPYSDGVDLNCGCPQRWAKEMNLGCEMLKNPQIIYDLVRECRNRISKPFTVSVKTRIHAELKETVEVCRQLEKSGVSFLTIHARTASDNVGPINVETLRTVVETVQIPVIGNGGVDNLEACYELQGNTSVKGVMVANGILTNPEIFSGANSTSMACVQAWLDICYNSTLKLDEYEKLLTNNSDNVGFISERPYNLTFQCFHHHLVFMMEKILSRKQRQIFNNLKTFSSVLNFLDIHFHLKPRLFPMEMFLKSYCDKLDYMGKNIVYDELRPKNIDFKEPWDITDYSSDNCNGNYFSNKLNDVSKTDCDWSSLFIEND